VEGYATWKDVVDRQLEFIQMLYCADRLDTILGERPSNTLPFASLAN
jgi:hypothetical protein